MKLPKFLSETFEAFLALSTPHKKIVREMIAALAKPKA